MRKASGRPKRLLGSAVAVTAGAAIALGGTASLAQASGPHIDGIVGKETFGVADEFLNGPSGGGHVTYSGYKHDVGFKRLSGTYYVKINDSWKKAAYNWRG
ncbi:hypothetical protein AB0I94_35405 [Streptomyces sp. NPDC050147]|uniref:hypothetical protein n=1 Tax=Streptomyces sp. NPDC050147 TaxID=3155513 RepID=UPI00343019C4